MSSDRSLGAYDVVIVGGGIAGLHQLIRVRELGFSVRLLEAGGGVGGTWYWNRYPGARLDSESYTYGYFFSRELLDRWSWSEEFVAQPELERYLNVVADLFELRGDIQLNCRVSGASWDDERREWAIATDCGDEVRARFLITAVGILAAPQYPALSGLDDFRGEWHHTALWPAGPVSFASRRVAVIGTGSSGVQLISAIAPEVAELTVFQRTPNWCTPLNNKPIDPSRADAIRLTSDEIFRLCMESPLGFIHQPRHEAGSEVLPAERIRHWDALWDAPGLSFFAANFRDVLTSESTNQELSAYLAQRIRERVVDPVVAEKLIPKDHGFGMKRPPLETGYYEVFNRDNVRLIELAEEPIETAIASGLRTSQADYDLDVIVLATGFDAVTGTLTRLDLFGRDGRLLRDYWADGPRTALGLQVAGFPNLFIVGGPQAAGGNNPRSSGVQVEWVSDCLRWLRDNGHQTIEPTAQAEQDWVDDANRSIAGTLLERAKSWSFGSNTPGKRRAYLLYGGGQIAYRERIDAAARNRSSEFVVDGVADDDQSILHAI